MSASGSQELNESGIVEGKGNVSNLDLINVDTFSSTRLSLLFVELFSQDSLELSLDVALKALTNGDVWIPVLVSLVDVVKEELIGLG